MISICIALIVDYFAGDPLWYPHPVKYMGRFITWFYCRSASISKKPVVMKWCGFLLTIVLITISVFLVQLVLFFLYDISYYLGFIAEILILWNCLALRCLDREVIKIYDNIRSRNVEGARKQLSFLVSRDTKDLTEEGIIRATVETAAENTSDGITAPLFFMLLGGAPLAIAYKAINTMDSMVGYKNEKYIDFGYFPAKLDDVANFIPSRLTGLAMVCFAFFAGMNYKNGWKILKRDAHKSKSPNAGFPEAAAAGILGVALCGDTYYFGRLVKKEFIGDSLFTPNQEHIKMCVTLMYGCVVIFMLVGFAIIFTLRWLF